MKIQIVRCDGRHEILTLTEPLTIHRAEKFNSIETGTGTSHFFTQEGLYDGWDTRCYFFVPVGEMPPDGLPDDVRGFIQAIEDDREIVDPQASDEI